MKKVSYTSHVRAPDGRVASVDAISSGVVRVQFTDKSTKLVPKSHLARARVNADRPARAPRPHVPSGTRSTVLGSVCEALGISPVVARRRLRRAGLSAPYTNEGQLFKVLK